MLSMEPNIEQKKKLFREKCFRAQVTCKCASKKKSNLMCVKKIGVNQQEKIFNDYYNRMLWSQKTMFIRGNVRRQPVKTKKTYSHPIIPLVNRNFNYVYSLPDGKGVQQMICRDFFLECLQITPNRVFEALKSAVENPIAIDRRGIGPSANKTKEADKETVRQFINSIPKYESHYGRSHSEKKYLHHSLNMSILYKEYKESQEMKNQTFVSLFIFREMFNTEFNLSFKRKHSDTCKTCDEFKVAIGSTLVPQDQKNTLEEKRKMHLQLVEETNANFISDVTNAKQSDGKTLVFTFDLQKSLETPSLTTSVAFYKRQLWTYNLCIYDEVQKKAYMHIWSENIASRGGQEIGSCLLKHFKDNISSETNRIILYSDSCGGQNRNIKITMLLKKFLDDVSPDESLEFIDQKYFVSGHSYNSCDRAFGLIEKHQKNSANGIFTPDDWICLIRDAKKNEPKFNVIVMQKEDFLSSTPLHSMIVNRKKNTEGEKINWLHFRTISYPKEDPFLLIISCGAGKKQYVRLDKKNISNESFSTCNLPLLYPDGRAISNKKLIDLMQLLKYVPAEKHEFFRSLKSDEEEDFGLASDVSED